MEIPSYMQARMAHVSLDLERRFRDFPMTRALKPAFSNLRSQTCVHHAQRTTVAGEVASKLGASLVLFHRSRYGPAPLVTSPSHSVLAPLSPANSPTSEDGISHLALHSRNSLCGRLVDTPFKEQ